MDDRRQYKRISYYLGQDDQRKLQGVTLTWPSEEVSEVFDLSYQGLACSFPLNFSIEEMQFYNFNINFNNEVEFRFKAQVRWFNDKAAGLLFEPLSVTARQALENYLNDKLIGANLFLVDKKYYSKQHTPDYWYHGPENTNVFLWLNGEELEELQIELNNKLLEFKDHKVTITKMTEEFEVQQQYSDDKQADNLSQDITKQKYITKALGVLSQLTNHKKSLMPLFERLRSL